MMTNNTHMNTTPNMHNRPKRPSFFFPRLAARNIRRNRGVYLPYLITCILTVSVFYAVCSLTKNPGLSLMFGGRTISALLEFGCYIVGFFALIFLFYTNSFLARRRQKEFGLYIVLGMERRHLARVVLWETIFLALLSLGLGLCTGILLDYGLFALFLHVFGSYTALHYTLLPDAALTTLLLFSIIFALIYLAGLHRIAAARPVELLHADRAGEREPRAKWALAILGICCLGGGYAISILSTNPVAAILLFFVAVILVIIGTYLLFTAGSIVLLKQLRKNKRYYYRADHFISVSGMIWRMKQNAVSLGNICILSTMVLVMLSSTLSLVLGVENLLNAQYPREIRLSIYDYNDAEDAGALQSWIDHACAVQDCTPINTVSYTMASTTALRKGNTLSAESDFFSAEDPDRFAELVLIPLSEYNRLTGERRTLEDGQALLLDGLREDAGEAYTYTSLSLFGRPIEIVGHLPAAVTYASSMSPMIESIICVLPEIDTFCRAPGERQDGEMYYPTRSRFCAFDLGGENPDASAFISALGEGRWRDGEETVYSNLSASYSSRTDARADFMAIYGGLLFVGIFLGALFLMAAILIIYYKQLSEGFDDRERFAIMQKVGLCRDEIRRSIHTQVRTVFFLPLIAAGIHVAFATPIIARVLKMLQMNNLPLYLACTAGCFLLFAAIYGAVYLLTSKVYYRLVRE